MGATYEFQARSGQEEKQLKERTLRADTCNTFLWAPSKCPGDATWGRGPREIVCNKFRKHSRAAQFETPVGPGPLGEGGLDPCASDIEAITVNRLGPHGYSYEYMSLVRSDEWPMGKRRTEIGRQPFEEYSLWPTRMPAAFAYPTKHRIKGWRASARHVQRRAEMVKRKNDRLGQGTEGGAALPVSSVLNGQPDTRVIPDKRRSRPESTSRLIQELD